MTKTVTVVLWHRSLICGARWCEPLGWEPINELFGTEYSDGTWWADEDEEAALLCFIDGEEGQQIQVGLDDLRVALCKDCQVIGPVVVADEEEDGADVPPEHSADIKAKNVDSP